jgi:hypothetical protein
MNCANHPELAAVAYCRTCGKPLCETCQRPAQGTIFCEEHQPQAETATGGYAESPYAGRASSYSGANPYTGGGPYAGAGPYSAPGNQGISPGLAFMLGLIPGVGAIYNGQYAKGLIHVLIFGVLISMLSSGAAESAEPLFGMMIMGFYFYMPFEAYHTAAKRQRGELVDEFSSIFPLKGRAGGFPVGPVILILVGVVFLLDTMDLIRIYQVLRLWPAFLIVLGVYLLVVRLRSSSVSAHNPAETASEVRNER